MAALTTGGAAPDWHGRGGHVASGCVGCYGCYGCAGCHGSWGGYAGGGFPGYGGACIGTWGGYSVTGPNAAYGCWGNWSANYPLTVYSGAGTYGYGFNMGGGVPPGYGVNYGLSFQCHGCYGCYGGWSCYGSPVGVGYISVDSAAGRPGYDPPAAVTPMVPAPPAPKVPETPFPKQAQIRSTVIIDVPQNAKLYVDDNLMKDGPTQRVFQTPLLNSNETYYYDLRVEVVNNGRVSTDRKRILIRPGETVTAAFTDAGRPEVVTVRNGAQK
jgi:uncharacterized protein (TIGR03000 family)